MKRLLPFGVLLFALSAASLAGAPTSARAQSRARPADRVRFDIHADLAWYGAFGLGARVDLPIAPRGIISGGSLQDDLVLSLGGDVFFWNSARYSYRCGPDRNDTCYSSAFGGTFGALVGAVQWNFYTGNFSFFPELGLAFIFCDSFYWRDRYYDGYFWPFLGGGLRWHFSASNALLIRASWPAGLQIGVTF
jgi:hypothetical protein